MTHPTTAQIDQFRDAVGRRLGLDLHVGKRDDLPELLHNRVRASNKSAASYLADVEAGFDAEELRVLAQELTVTETSFFRNPEQIRAFVEVALPAVARLAVDRPLRILSAGCASGEEAYTIASCVTTCPETAGRQVEIIGVDVNMAMLRKAAHARYSRWSLRQTPRSLCERMFRREGDRFVLADPLRKMVVFEERNLLADDPEFWRPGHFDIIFCRNVLMYFSPETMSEVVSRMARSLAPGGYLFLGYAESLRGVSADFDVCNTHKSFYYRRRIASAAEPEVELSTRSERAAVSLARRLAPPRRQTRQRDRPGTTPGGQPDLPTIADLIARERFVEADHALSHFERKQHETTPEALLFRAFLHMHGGDFSAAERICEDLLALNGAKAGAHYLMGLCCEARGDVKEAFGHNRVAAYLDPGFAMPRLQLGLMAQREGRPEEARPDLKQALLLLERDEGPRFELFAGGFTRTALASLCRSALAACEAAS